MRSVVTCAAFAATAVVSLPTTGAAAVLLHQSFETSAGYSVSAEFYDTSNDYFTRVFDSDTSDRAETPDLDIFDTSDTYTNIDGDYYFAGEDIDDTGATGADGLAVKTITFDVINTSLYQSLSLTGHFAGGSGRSFDPGDLLVVEVSVDGGPFVKVLQFTSAFPEDGNPASEHLAHDPDFDGIGDGAVLTNALTPYSAPLPLGDSLVLRITADGFDHGSGEFAIDAFTVTGSIPEPTGVAALGMVALALRRRRLV